MSIFLMGCYDPDSQKWCTVTKCAGGHDDATLARLQKELDMVKISKVRLNPGSNSPLYQDTGCALRTEVCRSGFNSVRSLLLGHRSRIKLPNLRDPAM